MNNLRPYKTLPNSGCRGHVVSDNQLPSLFSISNSDPKAIFLFEIGKQADKEDKSTIFMDLHSLLKLMDCLES